MVDLEKKRYMSTAGGLEEFAVVLSLDQGVYILRHDISSDLRGNV